jgi:Icc-related predicted phosphoesterase
MKVYVISDVHSDHKENMEWVEAHCAATSRPSSVLIIAGDVSDDLNTLRRTLELFASSYGYCFFCLGNHELWTRKSERGQYDSIEKLYKIQDLCSELGIFTAPKKIPLSDNGDSDGEVEGVWIVPIWSWYHAEWDQEPDIPGALPIERVMMDFHACTWTSEPTLSASGNDSIAKYFDALNDPLFGQIIEEINEERHLFITSNGSSSGSSRELSRKDEEERKVPSLLPSPPAVISFSHFLPFQDLLPEKRMLHYPNLAKASGSTYLATRVLSLQPDVHIFGHTHFTQDQVLDKIRFVQWPLGYPRDQMKRRDGGRGWEPLVVWDSQLQGGITPQKSAYWSDYYRQNERMPHIVDKAPWVVG